MLTVAEETLLALAKARGKEVVPHLYGQEINPETYAICKADMLLKGEGEKLTTSSAGPNGPHLRTMPSRLGSLTSCFPIHPMARVGRRTWKRWVEGGNA